MPLAFANQFNIRSSEGFVNENPWSDNNLSNNMQCNKKPFIGVKRKNDDMFYEETPSSKKQYNENNQTYDEYGCSSSSSIYKNFLNNDETSKALIPIIKDSYNEDENMEELSTFTNNIKLNSPSPTLLLNDDRQFPFIPSFLLKGNEVVLFRPEHPIEYYGNNNENEKELLEEDNDRLMEGRIEELPNDYDVEGNSIVNDGSGNLTNGINIFSTIKGSTIGVVELAEDGDDLCRDISNLSEQSTPLSSIINNTASTDQQFNHGPIIEELSDEEYTTSASDSPMEVD
uniref:Uncharacterized protein n=1 Tax=Parastrongyloides trichosuri TaxID=131310 RepID=A0A0N4ZUJ5_PARTI